MRVWSQGLGRTELEFNLAVVRVEEDTVVIEGSTVKPVIWKLRLTLLPEDIPALIRIALNRSMISLFLNYIGNKIRRRRR